MLHPSLDAHESRSQMTSVKGTVRTYSGRGPAVAVALVGGKLSSNKPLFDGVLNFDGWAIESGQSPNYGPPRSYSGPEVRLWEMEVCASFLTGGRMPSFASLETSGF